VGDGKYGGKDAFLTGTISRKMHLHARRLRIDHPSGEALDITANLPPHMAESFEDLGFDMALGDLMPLVTPKAKDTVEGKKRLVANIAKAARKERKGERRSRGSEVVAKGRTDNKGVVQRTGTKKPATKGKAIAKKPTSKKPGMKGGLRRGAPGTRGKPK
jgi:23S rRNA pseudouridine955/2504/2580 synthase